VTVIAEDKLGLTASQVLTFTIDNTPPDAGLADITEDLPNVYVSGDTVYYGPGSGAFTVTVDAGDPTAGLDEVTFPATTGDGAVYPQNGAYSATVSHAYVFDAASSFSGSTAVTVTDRARNDSIVPFAVLRDVVSPTVAITVPARSGVITVTVSWSGNDGAGVGATARRQVCWRVATHPHQSTPFSWSDVPPGHVAVLDKLWYNPGSVEWR